MLLAWRCLYAEITRVRIYKENPDIGAALVRTGAMCISRLMTYGASLAQMVQTTVSAYKRTKDI